MRLEPLTPPFPTQAKKQEQLKDSITQLSAEVSVPSPAHVPRLRWLGLCHGLRASVRLLFPDLCRGGKFGEPAPGVPAPGESAGPV